MVLVLVPIRCSHLQAGSAVLLSMIGDLEKLLSGHASAVNVVSQIIDAAVDLRSPLQQFVRTATQGVLFGATAIEIPDRSKVDPLLALLIEDNRHACDETVGG